MEIPDQSVVLETLRPLYGAVTRPVEKAWRDFLRMNGEFPIQNPRTRANWVWDRAVTHARADFGATPAVTILDRGNTTWFRVGKVVFRYKFAQADGFSSNYPTPHALSFHERQLALPQVERVWKVDLVYMLDEVEQAIIDIRVACRNGGQMAWQASIWRNPEIPGAQVTSIAAAKHVAGPEVAIKSKPSSESAKDEEQG